MIYLRPTYPCSWCLLVTIFLVVILVSGFLSLAGFGLSAQWGLLCCSIDRVWYMAVSGVYAVLLAIRGGV
jgi:hypothetical protein